MGLVKIKTLWPECANEFAAAIFIFHKVATMPAPVNSKKIFNLRRNKLFNDNLITFCKDNVLEPNKMARLFKVVFKLYNKKREIIATFPTNSSLKSVINLHSDSGSLYYIADLENYLSKNNLGTIFEILADRNGSQKNNELNIWLKNKGSAVDQQGNITSVVKFADEKKFCDLFGCGFTLVSLRLGPRMPIPIYHSRYERSRVPILRLATTDEWPQEKTSIQENDKFTIDYAGKVVKINPNKLIYIKAILSRENAKIRFAISQSPTTLKCDVMKGRAGSIQ